MQATVRLICRSPAGAFRAAMATEGLTRRLKLRAGQWPTTRLGRRAAPLALDPVRRLSL